ncbi:hypothetical protein [Pseudomonas indica]|uniref:hypothetical protein n=1 Tax=Pseudomonas indica TaxID=137658 RepID=UPI000BD88E11|nr:hypothetical protein [Pseudomonas indica]PAU65775.1 hypothetical protein BZL42_00030 [Pseudomonas indica]
MKTIFVPLSKDALERFDVDESLPGELLELKLNDVEFSSLCSSGIFEAINQKLNKLIDEYEDEGIDNPYELEKLLGIIEENLAGRENPQLEKLSQLTKAAIQYKTGIFFYF